VGFLAPHYKTQFNISIREYVLWNEVHTDDWFSLGGWPNNNNGQDRIAQHSLLYWMASDAIREITPESRVCCFEASNDRC